MKNSLLLFSAAFALSSVTAAAFPVMHISRKDRVVKFRVTEDSRSVSPSEKWLPGTITSYYWDGAWTENGVSEFTYDTDGKITEQTTEYDRTQRVYNAKGHVASVVLQYKSGDEYVNVTKTDYTYDTVLEDFVTGEVSYSWQNDQWVESWKNTKVITRNAEGCITSLKEYDNQGNITEELVITYGADGKAVTVTRYYDGELDVKLSDIVWDSTDGQIVDAEWDDEEFYQGANRIKSATLANDESQSAGKNITLTASYPDANGSFKYELTMDGEVQESVDYTALDAYGSYQKTEFSIDYDYDETTGTMVRDQEYKYEAMRKYDAYGLQLEHTSKEYSDNVLEYEEAEKGTVTYDTTAGYPLEYIRQSKYNGQTEYVNTTRALYSDYVKIVGAVSAVEADSDLPVEYFNLQGVRVDASNLTPGIYIMRQGNVTTKILRRCPPVL